MSPTKIVIIVLVLIALIFIVFVAAGALRRDPDPPKPKELESTAEKTEGPGWTAAIKDLFGSMKPKIKLQRTSYSSPAEENIAADKDHPFRTATFRLSSGKARIEYEDKTPLASDDPLREMDNPQECDLPNMKKGARDPGSCSILALKGGGTFTFKCTSENNGPCLVKVE